MTEDEKQEIRASFAGKRVSQMTDLERQVFNEDFQYGVAVRSQKVSAVVTAPTKAKSKMQSILERLGLTKN